VLASFDLAGWTTVGTLTNTMGALDFSLGMSGAPGRFFRAQQMSTP